MAQSVTENLSRERKLKVTYSSRLADDGRARSTREIAPGRQPTRFPKRKLLSIPLYVDRVYFKEVTR